MFIGSTNDSTFLRDNTSLVERRFWVIKCNKTSKDGKIFNVLKPEYINQLWAESVNYYRENPNMYLDISKELMEDFANSMMQFKTFSDDVVMDYVNAILEKTYHLDSKGEFRSERDMLEQYNDSKTYEDRANDKICKIPYSYLRFVLKNHYHEERTGKYIDNGLGNNWKYQSIRYKDNICRGFARQDCNQQILM